MAKRVIDDSTLTAIANKLRENVPALSGTSFTPLEMPNKIAVVKDAAFTDGQRFGRGEYETMLQELNTSLSEALTSGGGNEEYISTNIEQAKSDIGAIKDLLIDWGEDVPVGTPSSEYPEMIQSVYEQCAGVAFNSGWELGVREGTEQGKQAQYDEFWDSYQANGERAFGKLFNSVAWNDTTFKPKYSMKSSTGANGMFQDSRITDLQAILDRQGVTFDFSLCGSFANMLQDSTITHIGEVSTSSASAVTNLFYRASKLETVDLLVLKSDGSQTFSNSFGYCTSLKNIVINGVIAQNFDISYSPLTKNSITSVVEHLSGTATGKTLTLKKSAVNSAFGINVDDETTYPADSEFYVLRHSKDNWTFSYV